MLQHLYVKDIALIDEVSIDFDDKLNILTGETGAGKSIVIDAINIALGSRNSKNFLRENVEKGLVELLFKVEKSVNLELLEQYGIELDDTKELILSREMYKNGRNTCRANGHIVTVSMLRDIGNLMIDMHGQHEHQSLLDDRKHIHMLDQFCNEKIHELKIELINLLKLREIEFNKLKELNMDEKEKERKISMLEYEINEINQAKLDVRVDNEIESQVKVLRNSQTLLEGVSDSYDIIQSGDGYKSASVSEQLNRCLETVRSILDYDKQLSPIYKNLETINILIDEISIDIREYKDKIENNGEMLLEYEQRLDLIYSLKRKYGSTIGEIIEYKDNAQNELNNWANIEENIKNINVNINIYNINIKNICDKITKLRIEAANLISGKIEVILKSLNFEHANFKIDIKQKNNFSKEGQDEVNFLISTNIGEDLKSLSKIVSGGEMSRVMLALKTVLAEVDEISTLIFDEIDVGISGRAAQKVAEKLVTISNFHQVICITHLPQIAAMADRHYLISKKSNKTHNKTTTKVEVLNEDDIVGELARLIGGATITEMTIESAKEIKKMATELKIVL